MMKIRRKHLNVPDIGIHERINNIFCPFVEAGKDLHEKLREDITKGSSFTRRHDWPHLLFFPETR